MACKPGSVTAGEPAADGHSSGTPVARRLARPTRATGRKQPCRRAAPTVAPTWSCSRWGLPCRDRYRPRGALLPHPFTLAGGSLARFRPAVCFLWHFPWGRPRRTLSGTVLPWSPDFPHPAEAERGHPAIWRSRGTPSTTGGQAERAAKPSASAGITATQAAGMPLTAYAINGILCLCGLSSWRQNSNLRYSRCLPR